MNPLPGSTTTKHGLLAEMPFPLDLQITKDKSNPHAARTIKLGTRLHTPSPRGSNQNVVSNFSMTCRGAPMMPGRVLTTPLVMLLTIKEKRCPSGAV